VGHVGSKDRLRAATAIFFLLALVFSIASVLIASPGLAASPNDNSGAVARVPLLIKFRASASATDIAGAIQANGGVVTRDLRQIRTKVIYVPADARDRILAAFANSPSVERAAPAVAFSRAGTPNDTDYAQQWALPKIAWDQAYGTVAISGHATIAVLDTGIDATHPDLAGRVVAGASFTGGDANSDPNGHGTALAGIAAANVDDGIGMAGVAYAGTDVASVQVLQADGSGLDADVVAGVLWAADNGASVILMGFSSADYSFALADAIAYAWGKGATIVAATGNGGSTAYSYPAGMPYVVGVDATDQDDTVASFSNTGSALVSAPGVAIYATQPGGGYTTTTGTSAAAAHAAGLAALLMASGNNNAATASKLQTGADNGRIGVAASFDADGSLPAPAGTPVGGLPDPTYTVAVVTSTSVGSQSGSVTYGTGGSVTYAVTVGGTGNDSRTVQVTGLPTGASYGPTTLAKCNLSQNECNFTLTITTTGSGASITPAGSSTFTVKVDNLPATGAGTGTLAVSKAASTTVFGAAPTPTYLGGNFTVSANNNSGGTITYSKVSGPCDLVSGATFSSSGAGACLVQADSAATTNYNASSAQQSVTIAKAAQSMLSVTAPNSITYGNTGTAATSGGSGTGAVTFSTGASTGCSVSGTTVSVSNASGTCALTATKAADNNYNSTTSAAFPVTLNKIAPTTTFTGAPLTKEYQGTFTVSSTTNASTSPAYSATGVCTNAGAIFTMTSSTSTCTSRVDWLTDNNYMAAYRTQTTTATKRPATLTFTGAPLSQTPTTSALVTLSAHVTVTDCLGCDLRLAQVTFTLNKSNGDPVTNLGTCAGVLAMSSSGDVSCALTLGLDSYDVTVSMHSTSYYSADSDTGVVTVYQPGQSVTGGGWIVDPSQGVSPTNKHGNFGFNVQWDKNGSLKGQAVFIYRGSNGYIYKFKSNSWQGGTLGLTSTTAPMTAFFTGKCNLQVTNAAGTVISSQGSLNCRVDMTDAGEPGANDYYAFSATDGFGNVIHQAGTAVGKIRLGGGNIKIQATK
jgi:subtilisin family serine protease